MSYGEFEKNDMVDLDVRKFRFCMYDYEIIKRFWMVYIDWFVG